MTLRPVGIVLFGPPASGKDTVTQHLQALSDRYRLFEKLKVGAGRAVGYRMVDQAVHDKHTIVHSSSRYGNTYSVDAETLGRMWSAGHIPVIHMGQMDGVVALKSFSAEWHCVLLTCNRDVAADRIAARATGDLAARLAAWDEIVADTVVDEFDLLIDTSKVRAAESALRIHQAIGSRG